MCARGGIGEDQRHVLGSHIAAIGAISAASAAFDPANDPQLPILADGNGTSDFVRFALGEDRNFGKIPLGAAHHSSKNHTFHAPAAHGFGRAFAHDPPHTFNPVGLPPPVRSYTFCQHL